MYTPASTFATIQTRASTSEWLLWNMHWIAMIEHLTFAQYRGLPNGREGRQETILHDDFRPTRGVYGELLLAALCTMCIGELG